MAGFVTKYKFQDKGVPPPLPTLRFCQKQIIVNMAFEFVEQFFCRNIT